jgi:RNA polymerase sigma-70 factor (sigma-E family)
VSESDDEYVAFVAGRLPALKRLAYLLCGDNHRADDLVQETITKLYSRWLSARTKDNLDRYVRTVLVRTHIDDTRRPWSRVRLFGALPEQTQPPESSADERAYVRAALAVLPPTQRAVLVLRYLCDLPVSEVAVVLDLPDNTVKSHTARGLERLRRSLAKDGISMTTNGG